jgi:hypothetical protein
MGDWEASEQLLTAEEVLVLSKIKGKKHKFAKRVLTDLPAFPEYYLFDLQCDSRGFDEDAAYASNSKLLLNVRRGNSVLAYTTPVVGKTTETEKMFKTGEGEHEQLHLVASATWVRRGLRKFFDIYKEFLGPFKDLSQSTFNSTDNSRFDEHKKNVRRIIFKPIEDALLSGEASVSVYKTNKANGENAQVSYCGSLDCWVVSSKNVSMLLRSRADIAQHTKERFAFAKLIAEEWFRVVERLDDDQVRELKSRLEGFSLVGEYVGNNDFQHLVKYSSQTVVFYALVDNNSRVTCLPPILALAFLQRFGIDHVKVEKFGTFRRLDELYGAIDELFSRVATQSIEDGEEGSVLYFTRDTPDVHPLVLEAEAVFFSGGKIEVPYDDLRLACEHSEVVSLAKLKTLEYRVWRKLREKLKNFAAAQEKSKSASMTLEKFKKETKELIAGHTLPQPIEYYFEIAAKAYKAVDNNPPVIDMMRHYYVDFLAQLIRGEEFINIAKVSQPSLSLLVICPPGYFSKTELIEVAAKLGYGLYLIEEWKKLPETGKPPSLYVTHNLLKGKFSPDNIVAVMVGFTAQGRIKAQEQMELILEEPNVDKRLVSFKSTDLGRRLDYLFEHMQELETSLKDIPYYCEVLGDGSVDSVVMSARGLIDTVEAQMQGEAIYVAPKGHKTFVIVPLTIPAIGKSWLAEVIREAFDCPLSILSSDKVRREAMDAYQVKFGVNRDVAFDKTTKSARGSFMRELAAACSTVADPISIVFLDKNHPPNGIEGLMRELTEKCSRSRDIIVIGLVPECSQPFTYGGSYPFSIHLLIQCLLRIKDRAEHLTLQGSLAKRAGIVCMFFKMFKGCDFDDCLEQGFHRIVRVPFTDETEREYPHEVLRALHAVFEQSHAGQDPDERLVNQLYEHLESLRPLYSPADPAGPFVAQLKQIFTDFSSSVKSRPLREVREERKAHREESKLSTRPSKAPVYLALDLAETLGHEFFNFLNPALLEITQIRNVGQGVAAELRKILNQTKISQFASEEAITSGWRFPASMHLTVVFLGGKYSPADAEYYRDFVEGREFTLELTQLLYVPATLICASARFIGDSIPVKNAKPHVTLMLNGATTAKKSNMFLESLKSSFYELDQTSVKVEGKSYNVYVLPLQPGRAQFVGTAKAFTN